MHRQGDLGLLARRIADSATAEDRWKLLTDDAAVARALRGTKKAPKASKARTTAAPAAAGWSKRMPRECNLWGDAFADAPLVAGGVDRKNIRATYHFYSPAYETSSLACADRFWADPAHGRKLLKYPWTAYCLDGKAFSQSTCGKCLRLTNARTGAAVTARAVDFGGCTDADGTGLDLDPCAFDALDTDGQGRRDGNLRVDVREVDCGLDGEIR